MQGGTLMSIKQSKEYRRNKQGMNARSRVGRISAMHELNAGHGPAEASDPQVSEIQIWNQE